jgi:PAS domain S-box-containing protein
VTGYLFHTHPSQRLATANVFHHVRRAAPSSWLSSVVFCCVAVTLLLSLMAIWVPSERLSQFTVPTSLLVAVVACLAACAISYSRLLQSHLNARDVQELLEDHNEKLRRTILEHRHVVEELRNERRRLELAIRGSTDGLWDWDLQTNEVWYSNRFKEMLGYAHDEFAHEFESWESQVHPDDHDALLTKLLRHLEAGRPFDVEHRLRTKNLDYRWFHARGVMERNADGEPSRMAGSIQDVTDRKLDERKLKVLNEALEQRLADSTRELQDRTTELEKLRSEMEEFTFATSHDLQEPLRKLMTFSELLEQDIEVPLNAEGKKDLHYIIDASRRMQRLVQDMVALSRVGQSMVGQEVVRLDNCVDQALDALETQIQESGALITRDRLPIILGRESTLAQVYQHLISNALKFVKGRIPVIHLTVEDGGQDWILGVLDNGVGIEEKYVEQVFAPFQRLHSRAEFDGTGIGLTICRKAVERHGGRIWVESTPEEGSHFRFTLRKVEMACPTPTNVVMAEPALC